MDWSPANGQHLIQTNHTLSVKDRDINVRITDVAGAERGETRDGMMLAGGRLFASALPLLPVNRRL